jgi:hypothetical protein
MPSRKKKNFPYNQANLQTGAKCQVSGRKQRRTGKSKKNKKVKTAENAE